MITLLWNRYVRSWMLNVAEDIEADALGAYPPYLPGSLGALKVDFAASTRALVEEIDAGLDSAGRRTWLRRFGQRRPGGDLAPPRRRTTR